MCYEDVASFSGDGFKLLAVFDVGIYRSVGIWRVQTFGVVV